jgi:hypothetical protein
MAAVTVEERLASLESEVAEIKSLLPGRGEALPWWKQIVGIYKDDPEFEEADRLGREWRQSFKPKDDEVAPL